MMCVAVGFKYYTELSIRLSDWVFAVTVVIKCENKTPGGDSRRVFFK